jgi:CRISPR-associated endonuclease/helicase Cas3
MNFTNFAALFQKATGNPQPFPYQERYASADELPELVHAPTGSGKTATAVLGWAWRYFYSGKKTPRRLVYCLPMRVLVEQTRDEARKWLANIGLADKVKVHVLMGGEVADEWDHDPEKPAFLIGTQDMLLSRALNRGYGMGRFRWPMHFGLLNNDCLWVLDEIQLMGVGLATSTQLQAFRQALGVFGTVKTVWMSATLLPGWLASVDFRDQIEPELRLGKLELDPTTDYTFPGLQERWNAKKPIRPAALVPSIQGRKQQASPALDKEVVVVADDTPNLAKFVVQKHHAGSLTLVIVNTVDRSRALFKAICDTYHPAQKGRKKATVTSDPVVAPDLKLIHSRFRPKEREEWRNWLTQSADSLLVEHPQGRIVVSTQVVEAGVDLSARTLITELAPWPSLVQRFGRCNRRGEFLTDNPAQIYWVDVPSPDDKKAAPYSKDELDAARERLATLPDSDAGLKSLTTFFNGLKEPERAELFPCDPPHVIRRKDFIDLFDTTTDMAGNDIDVSRFIRDGDEIDVQVFWRPDTPPKGELNAIEGRRVAPVRNELCTVRVGDFRVFLDDHTAHRWDTLTSEWVKADAATVFPGQVYWLATAEGGYDARFGWNPNSDWSADLWLHDPVDELESQTTEEPGYDTDLLSVYGWRSIAEHTEDVVAELGSILSEFAFQEFPREVLTLAARWHDWGKAHNTFQAAIRDEANGEQRPPARIGKRDIAKAAPKQFWQRYERPHFRHELASALGVLALLKAGQAPKSWTDLDQHLQSLALYLIAAHHGKVRVSIRSMPGEKSPDQLDALFARGVWQGDTLPSVDLGDSVVAPATKLDLASMQLGRVDGQSSWAERMLGLRDHKGNADEKRPRFGPLKLAYLEALIRAADMRASKGADDKAKKAVQL